jgi:5-aminolevulinate synthase
MIDNTHFTRVIDKFQGLNQYRVFNDIVRHRGNFPTASWHGTTPTKRIINWCSNDYLGMGQNQDVIDAMHVALDSTGAGSGGTRNISGTSTYHVMLESELADLHKQDRALLFSSAYVANEWSLIALSKIIPDIEFVSDSKNHSSIIQGILHSRAPKSIWQHNCMTELEACLKTAIWAGRTPCIVFESVYSMDGDVSPIIDILDLADRYGAMTYIDEVHAMGLYGDQGAGYLEMLGVQSRVDIVNATLGKSVGVTGGYIAANKYIIDAIRLVASGFIFTTSLSPVICAGALASIKYIRQHNELRTQMQTQSKKLKDGFISRGIEVLDMSCTHIVPVMIRDARVCQLISSRLMEKYDIYVQAIQYPTVPVGQERLRFVPTPLHTDEMIQSCVDAVAECVMFYET